jgi:alpha-beta hydrolase superfamily lysophospholipase
MSFSIREVRAPLRASLNVVLLIIGLQVSPTLGAAQPVRHRVHQNGPEPTAAMLEAPLGPFDVAEATVKRIDANGFGGGTIYYPAARGTYATIAIAPGFTGYQSSLAWLGPKLASHGFVAIIIDTFTTSDQPAPRAQQLIAALRQVSELSASRRSPLHGKVDKRRLGVMGHSMGGGGALIAARDLPELKASIPLMPWNPDKNIATEVPTLIIACERDTIAQNSAHSIPFYDALPNTLSKAYLELKGQSHFCPQLPPNYPLMGRYAIAWMKRFLDNDVRYAAFLCGDAHQVVASSDKFSAHRSTCPF